MKTDLYTKAILTIIAICLLVVASEKIYNVVVPEAQAETKPMDVRIVQNEYETLQVAVCDPRPSTEQTNCVDVRRRVFTQASSDKGLVLNGLVIFGK